MPVYAEKNTGMAALTLISQNKKNKKVKNIVKILKRIQYTDIESSSLMLLVHFQK